MLLCIFSFMVISFNFSLSVKYVERKNKCAIKHFLQYLQYTSVSTMR